MAILHCIIEKRTKRYFICKEALYLLLYFVETHYFSSFSSAPVL